MTTHRIRLVLATAILVAATACQSPPPPATANSGGSTPAAAAAPAAAATPDLSIPLVFSLDSSGNCVGSLMNQNHYLRNSRRKWSVQWKITNNNCGPMFDYTLACVHFSNRDKVLTGGFRHCGKDQTMAIDANVSASTGDAPDDSTHLYSIRYNGKAGGDPELDIICDTCSL